MGKGSLEEMDRTVSEPVQQKEVPTLLNIENFQVLGLHPDDASFYINFSEERRKKVTWKVFLSFFIIMAGCLNADNDIG